MIYWRSLLIQTFELEYNLKEKGKSDLLKLVDETTVSAFISFAKSHPRGLEMPFYKPKLSLEWTLCRYVRWWSDGHYKRQSSSANQTKRNEYCEETTIAVMKVPHDDVSSYGVIDPQGEGVNGLYSGDLCWKTKTRRRNYDLAIIGLPFDTRNLLHFGNTSPGAGNEPTGQMPLIP